jgi:hypothetical protein
MFVPLEHVTPEADHDTLRKLAKQVNPGVAIEVGSWAGSTALTLAPHFSRLYCVDTFQGSDRLKPIAESANSEVDGVFRVFCHNVRDRLMNSIIPCVGKSLEWANVWPYSVDLIFIDADHEYEAVLADINAWKVHCHGILCGHDYSPMFPGVVRAVQESFQEFNTEGNVWWVNNSQNRI